MGSDPFPIQISLDKPFKRNTPLTEPRYRFDKTNDDLLHKTLKDSLTNIDTNITTQDELEELAVRSPYVTNSSRQSIHPHLKCTAAMTPNLLLVRPSWTSSRRNVGLGGCTITHRTLIPNHH